MKLHTVTFQYRKNWLEPQECGHFRASCTPMPPECEKSLQGHLDPAKAEIDSWKPSQRFEHKWKHVPNIGDENEPVQWQEGLPRQRRRRFGNETQFLKPKAARLEMEGQRECEMNCSVFHLRAWKHSAPPHSNHESASASTSLRTERSMLWCPECCWSAHLQTLLQTKQKATWFIMQIQTDVLDYMMESLEMQCLKAKWLLRNIWFGWTKPLHRTLGRWAIQQLGKIHGS